MSASIRRESPNQIEAIGLYRSTGYTERGPFGTYVSDSLSLFMEKRIGG